MIFANYNPQFYTRIFRNIFVKPENLSYSPIKQILRKNAVWYLGPEVAVQILFRSLVYFRNKAFSTLAHISMTSLFAHKVAQPTKWRFLPKNLSQLVIFVIGLAFAWSQVDKNRSQFQKTNYFTKLNYYKIVLLLVVLLI